MTLSDLENSIRINQFLNYYPISSEQEAYYQKNVNFLLQQNPKANLITKAMLQLQNQNIYNKNLLLNCIQSSTNSIRDEQKNHINSGRYKTELCRQFIENGGCKYGDKCQFAHGKTDLKDVNRHPKYKTDYCKTFHSKGFCPYGPRCHFIHEISEKFEPMSNSIKKLKSDSIKNIDDAQLENQLEALHSRLSTNLFVNDDNYNVFAKHAANHLDDLNSSFLSSSSSSNSPMIQHRTRSGTSSTSSLISSSSSYDLNQFDNVFSSPKTKKKTMRPNINLPISKDLIHIGRNLIHEKLTNPNKDLTTLNQRIQNIERLNDLLNSNQLNFYHHNNEY